MKKFFEGCEYDDSEFTVERFPVDHLEYIGGETDGSKIRIPAGLTSCFMMFAENESLLTPPAIPEGVTDCSYMFMGCTNLREHPVLPGSVEYTNGMLDDCCSLPLLESDFEDGEPCVILNCEGKFCCTDPAAWYTVWIREPAIGSVAVVEHSDGGLFVGTVKSILRPSEYESNEEWEEAVCEYRALADDWSSSAEFLPEKCFSECALMFVACDVEEPLFMAHIELKPGIIPASARFNPSSEEPRLLIQLINGYIGTVEGAVTWLSDEAEGALAVRIEDPKENTKVKFGVVKEIDSEEDYTDIQLFDPAVEADIEFPFYDPDLPAD